MIENLISTTDEYLFRFNRPRKRGRNYEYDHPLCGLTFPVELEGVITPVKIWRKCYGQGAQGTIVDNNGKTTDENVWFGGSLLKESIERFKQMRNLKNPDIIKEYNNRRKQISGRLGWAGGNVYHIESKSNGLSICGKEVLNCKHTIDDTNLHKSICKTCIKLAQKIEDVKL